EQRSRRPVEHSIDELAHERGDDAPLRARRPVAERPAFRAFLQVSLRLKRAHHRHHGRVGDWAPLAQRLVDLAHGRFLKPPDDFHDGELPGAEAGLGAGHDYYSYSTCGIVVNSGGAWKPENAGLGRLLGHRHPVRPDPRDAQMRTDSIAINHSRLKE